MAAVLASLGLFVLFGAAALIATRWTSALSRALGACGAVLGCLALVPSAVVHLAGAVPVAWTMPWPVPGGALSLGLDPLTGFFLLVLAALGTAASVYGYGYLAEEHDGRSAAAPWVWLNGLLASMTLVLVARNAVLFLVAWEAMTLASFFLVTREDEREDVRAAGWTYLVASHLGTACLLALFALLGREGSLDFSRLAPGATPAGWLFGLTVLGFGVKAGWMPLHVWLPEAHPAAPSHVSALMSGVMITLGVYGLLRILPWLGPPRAGWGMALVAVGAGTAVLGVLWAAAQRDLKRLLAYSSVENAGIIALGIGLGVLGAASRRPEAAATGFAGALLHVANHAAFKGLLFLGAGAAAREAGTRDLERLGGLLRTMPRTGASFLLGSAAICGLPPLNGFMSELLVFLAALDLIAGGPPSAAAAGALAIAALALAGGLAVACFTKACGVAWLGAPRSAAAAKAHEASGWMTWPQLALAAACVTLAAGAPRLAVLLAPVIAPLAGTAPAAAGWALEPAVRALRSALGWGGAAALLAAVLLGLAARLRRGREVHAGPVWGCAYPAPTPRMQYTASSFAAPLLAQFAMAHQAGRMVLRPAGLFPSWSTLSTEPSDMWEDRFFRPVAALGARLAGPVRRLQHGRLQLYVLYVALTLVAVVVWNLA